MANKITYLDKMGLAPKGIAINQWQDDDANEVKDKHNLNDDRVTNLEDNQVTGVETYSTFASLPGTGTLLVSYKVTNDPTSSLNGYYHWTGAAYVKDSDLTTGVVEEGDVDALSGDTVYEWNKDSYETEGLNLYNSVVPFSESFILNSVNGQLVANASYNTTGFFKATPGQTVVCSSEASYTALIEMRAICAYDASEVYIAGVDTVDNYVVPANTKYLKISFNIADLLTVDFTGLQVEYGLLPSSYIEYVADGFSPAINYFAKDIPVSALSDSDSPNLIDEMVEGIVDTTGATSDNIVYWRTKQFLKVSEGDIIVVYEDGVYLPVNMRMVAAYDSGFVIVPAEGVENETSYTVPAGVANLHVSIQKTLVTEKDDLQASIIGVPVIYESYGNLISKDVISRGASRSLRNVNILSYGDSLTAGDQWLNIAAAYTGFDKFRNIAIGGGNIKGFSTRDEILNPYDWRVDYPNSATDDYDDRNLVPQTVHTPNTLRWKYDLISPEYLQDSGNYVMYPDIVTIAIGFNDWKNSDVNTFETYDDVKDLDYAGLVARANDAGVTVNKDFTYLRIALENLLSGEILETQDAMTYGVDCRKSKFIFSTPIQNANPFTYVDGGTAAHTKTLQEFGDYLTACLDDYGIKRINGYSDSSICWRYEIVGASGRYLADGIHPNDEGYKRMGEMIGGGILSTFLK